MTEVQAAPFAQVGIMARAGLEADSTFATITVRPSGHSLRFQYRDGSRKSVRGGISANVDFPVWLRLTRSRDSITGEFSRDGVLWETSGTVTYANEKPLPREMTAGIVALSSAGGATEPLHATLCAIGLESGFTRFRFVRGDSNADGAMDLSDAIAILSHMFLGDRKVRCEQAGDANDDGALDISDGIHLLGFLFDGGKPIAPPSTCGTDPTGHDLSCESFPCP